MDKSSLMLTMLDCQPATTLAQSFIQFSLIQWEKKILFAPIGITLPVEILSFDNFCICSVERILLNSD